MHYRWMTFDLLTASQLYELLAFRQDIFIVEQSSAFQDLDGRDATCWHLLVRDRPGGPLRGYLRASGPVGAEPAFIGRISTVPELRGTGLGGRMIAEGLSLLNRLHPLADVKIGAQSQLEGYYRRFGFEPEGDLYDDGGILHRTMWRRAASAMAA
jgi:ElaA protein